MIALSIVDGDTPIATADVVPDIDDGGEDSRAFAPLVEFRVLRYELLPGYEPLRATLRAAGIATRLFGHPEADSEEACLSARQAIRAAEAIEARLQLLDPRDARIEGRVTMFRESDFGGRALHSIGIALAERYVQVSQSAHPNERCN